VQLLTSPRLARSTRWQVVESLGNIDPGNQKAIDALVEMLSYPNLDDETRWRVAESLGNIDPGNQKAIDALVEMLSYPNLDDETRYDKTRYDKTRWRVAESLGNIDPGNQKAIDALVEMLSSPNLDDETRYDKTRYDETRWRVAESLGNIDPGNQKAIDALVQLLNSFNLAPSTRWEVTESLKKIPIDKQFAVIIALKANFNDSQQIDEYYGLIWHYAQNLPYPDFYQAWHQDTLTNPATASLNLSNLPKILAEAINDRPDLCNKVKLICIDSDKFVNPENPATKIYNEMRLQGCDKSQDSKPKTIAELQDYWDELKIESEIPLFFICYDSTALSATPTGFSALFLKALSKFDRAICVACEPGDIPLPTFSPSQPNLIADIVAWIREKMMEQ
jgi:HEAT repeats